MKPASMQLKIAVIILGLILAILPRMVAAQNSTKTPPAPGANSASSLTNFPKLWHSEATQHDFRVEVAKDLFKADWVNIPPAAAKQGAQIHTECRRTGPKWVGSSNIKMLFGVPGAPAGKDTKLCAFSVRFEVDALSAEKITGHSEALHSFDVNTCHVQQTSWGAFTWVPKKQ
ncbi:MAG TPA: hypothetical protein VMO17_11080 [Terriglobia bacterium]|nr:hypothetical protein [Terriglobia bacterium]